MRKKKARIFATISHSGKLFLMRIAIFLALALLASAAEPTEFFEAKIRPLLVNRCYACHTDKASAGLRVDSRAALLKGGKSGPAIVPGDPPPAC